MVLSEAALYALFLVWRKAGSGEAITAKWVSGGNLKAPASGHGHGHGPQFFSTISEAFRKKYMTFTTMGHMARHPLHCWGRGQQFREAIGAPRKPLAPWHTPMYRQQHRFLSMRWGQRTPPLRRCATAVQGCGSAVVHTLHVWMIVGRVGKRPMVQLG